jgi:replicative DNA helicase
MTNRTEIESSLLASLMKSNNFVRDSVGISVSHFADELHGRIFTALKDSNGGCDTLAIKSIAGLNDAECIVLVDISTMECSERNIGLYHKKLIEIIIADKIQDFKLINHDDVFEAQEEIQKLNYEISKLTSITRKNKSRQLDEFVDYIEANKVELKRIKTPFPMLDTMLAGGFVKGSFVLVGGTPGSGKTSLMLQMALTASQHGIKTYFIEGEMTELEMYERAIGILTGEDINEIRIGEHATMTLDAIDRILKMPLELLIDTKRNLSNIISEIEIAVANGFEYIFVDYLQVFSDKSGRSAQDEFMNIKKVSEGLRQVALKNNITLIVASSLNRNEGEKKIGLASFYGSSGLGHDCSQALILQGSQDEKEVTSRERNIVLSMVKNRSGIRGDINLKYYLASQKMVEISGLQEPYYLKTEKNEAPF